MPLVREAGPWLEAAVRKVLFELLPVLTYVHRKGIIYRDIKPANIILCDHGHKSVLIDFGAVKEVVAQHGEYHDTNPTIITGSPGFMPREQRAGEPVFVSDLYGLGVSAAYLPTGQHSADVVNAMTGRQAARQQLPAISPQLRAVLAQATEPLVHGRYQTEDEMLSALDPAPTVIAPPVQMQRTGAPLPLPAQCRHRRLCPIKPRRSTPNGGAGCGLHSTA